MSFREMLARLWHHLGARRRRHFALLMVLVLISAVAEVVSLGAVLPFIGVLAAPEQIYRHPIIGEFARSVGITEAQGLVVPLTIAFACTALLAALLRIFVTWVSTRLSFASGADLSIEIYRRTLYQPYSVHVSRSSNELISGITGKVGRTILGVMLPLLTLVSSAIFFVAIMVTLIAIEPFVAFVAVAGFGGSYLLITRFARRRLRVNSELIAEQHTRVVKALQEGLGGIRDVLLDGSQEAYFDIYRAADRRWRLADGDNVFIGRSPRFAIEALGMVLIAVLALVLSRQPGGITSALPVLGALVFGAQRLLPVLQQGYGAWSSMTGSHASFRDTLELLEQPVDSARAGTLVEPLPFLDRVTLDGVRFRYGHDSPWVLDGIDLDFAKGTRIGIVGSTGSGKSTLMDVLLGLLVPTEGELVVDGKPLDGRDVRAWQRSIAHVPQNIFLADASLAENIAFGVPADKIDHARVREAARKAQIAEFIEASPEGYDAIVGERGVRLSGGQRQRIGIARALYKRAIVLVLDEATSALDTTTERSVMRAIAELGEELTVFIIAHRLTTVQECDVIVEMSRGRVIAQGTFDELMNDSATFRQMVRIPEAS